MDLLYVDNAILMGFWFRIQVNMFKIKTSFILGQCTTANVVQELLHACDQKKGKSG